MPEIKSQSAARLETERAQSAPVVPSPGLRIDPAGSLKKHWLLAIAVFFLILSVGLPVAWMKGKPKYSAGASIFVSPRFIANLQDDKEFELQSNSQYREYVQQTVRTINRFDILLDVVTNLGPHRSEWVKGQESLNHAAERLQAALDVQPVTDTYQILVSLEGDKAEGLAFIVNAVVDTFLRKAKSEELFGTDERLQNLQTERAGLLREIETNQAKRAAIAQEIGVTTFNDSFQNPYDKLLVDAKSAAAEARRARILAEAQMQSVDPQQHPGSLESYALDSASKDPALASLEANFSQRRGVVLSTLSGLASEHPGRRTLEKELAQMDAERSREFTALVKSYSETVLKQREADAFRALQVEKNTQGEVNRQASHASWMSARYQAATAIGQDMERARKRLDSIDDRISFLSLESRAPGFIRSFAPARTPEEPLRGGRRKLFLLVGMAAFLFACVIPAAVDAIDPAIRWPGDVQRVLGFPVTGWVMEKSQAGADFENEQIVRLAGRLAQERDTHGSRVFAFTAATAGAGTTTLVLELARALRRLGIATLAVESNAYRPDERFRGANSRGLISLLRGERTPATEIVPGDAGLPDHIPVGHTELKSLPDLQNLTPILQCTAQIYSIVLVDLPPVLASADAELIARTCDVVTIVIEAGKVTRDDLKKVARQLERVNPKAVSAVLNRVRAEAARGFAGQAREEYYAGRPAKSKLARWLWT